MPRRVGDLAEGNRKTPRPRRTAAVPGFVRKAANKPNDTLQRTFETELGGISGPSIRKRLLNLSSRRAVRNLREAKAGILVSLRNSRGFDAADKLAARATERLRQEKDFQKVAQEFAAEANMNPADMVRETPHVVPGDDVPKIGANQEFEKAIESLNNPQDVGERTRITGGVAVPMLVDKKEPGLPEFDEVREKVVSAVKLERAKAQVEEIARTLSPSATSAADLKAPGKNSGLRRCRNSLITGDSARRSGRIPVADEAISPQRGNHQDAVKVADHVLVGATNGRKHTDGV